VDTLTKTLRAILGRDQVLSEPEELLVYECDALPQHKFLPRAVVFPHSTSEVSEVLRALAREGTHFAPRGAGTGLSGGALALNRGVVIELARMRRLLKVDAENRLAVVETGLVNARLSRAVAPLGLHYAPDPSSQATCTIGGNIAENAGGIHCLKYGTTVDHVVGVRVVLSDGEVVDLGGGAEANGYDLVGVFVGSEGTFGIATEATLRLTPLAPAVRTLLADFTDINDASRAVSAIIADGIIPAALEMVDGATIRAVEASVFAANLPTDAEAALLVELDGLEAGLDEETSRVEAVCLAHGARKVRRAADEHERKRLWAARKGAFGAMGRISPDLMLQDAVVPRSRLPEVLADTYRIGAKYSLRVANVFHAGDGNLHPYICFDSRQPEEVKRVKEAGREIMETCVRAGGTITGEHGVGMDKSEYLPLIFSDDDLLAMLQLRAAFDPLGLCNPGKIIPAPPGCGEARAAAAQARSRLSGGNGADKQAAQEAATFTEGTTAETPAAAKPAWEGLLSQRSALTSRTADPRSSFDADAATDALTRIVTAEHVRVAAEFDSVLTVAPGSDEEAREVLRLAASESWTVVPAGAGTWLDAGNSSGRPDLIVETTRLTRIIEHEPADLVATAEAGVGLSQLNQELGRAGQWLPLDPPGGACVSVGGVAATGLTGCQSIGYGAPRSHVLGMRVALADGRLIRVGGRVVKNVAGYDLCKLFVGSYGTLGLILDLTFKLRPRPSLQTTVVARCADYLPLLGAARAVLTARLLPVAVEILSPRMSAAAQVSEQREGFALLIRFAGTSPTVAHQVERASEVLKLAPGRISHETRHDDLALWTYVAEAALRIDAPLVWRASLPPTELGAFLSAVSREESSTGNLLEWQAGAGDGRLRVCQSVERGTETAVSALENWRRAAHHAGGHLTIEEAPAEIKSASDAWGLSEGSAGLMRRVKEQFDPQGMFSPGRFF
jgi:glycolate oxidase subunit GlcD